MVYYAAVEAGGTTFVVAVMQDDVLNIVSQKSIDTTTPDETLPQVIAFFQDYQKETGNKFSALGVASFGPINVNKQSEKYGFITSTPKEKWRNCDILGTIRKALNIDVFEFDTDVNAAALAMALHFSTNHNVHSLSYTTVGTGIGVGVLSHNHLVHGQLHPEGGHIYVKRAKGDSEEKFKGTCPFHGDCLEGLCATGALSARKGISAKELANLSDSDEIWDFVAYYLAQSCFSLIATVSPQVVVLGGGVMQRTILFPKVKEHLVALNNGYLDIDVAAIIHESPFGQNAGIIGAAALAKNAEQQHNESSK